MCVLQLLESLQRLLLVGKFNESKSSVVLRAHLLGQPDLPDASEFFEQLFDIFRGALKCQILDQKFIALGLFVLDLTKFCLVLSGF